MTFNDEHGVLTLEDHEVLLSAADHLRFAKIELLNAFKAALESGEDSFRVFGLISDAGMGLEYALKECGA